MYYVSFHKKNGLCFRNKPIIKISYNTIQYNKYIDHCASQYILCKLIIGAELLIDFILFYFNSLHK